MHATRAWLELLHAIVKDGTPSSPREMSTRELLARQSVIDMSRPVVDVAARKLNFNFMAAEAAWIMSGMNTTHTIGRHCKKITQFSDDGVFFRGAYGPKVVDQLSHVMATLSRDRDSRQAVVNIWRENPPPTRDVPCTLSLQWLVRFNRLHCVASMRSSDVWLGWPYDVFNFSMLSAGVLLLLGDPLLLLGDLHLTAASQHLYERDLADAQRVLADQRPALNLEEFKFEPGQYTYQQLVNDLWLRADGTYAPRVPL